MHPPRLAQFLVSVLVAEPEREFLLGDLAEQFAAVRSEGRLVAWRWYWSQVFRSTWHVRQVALWRKTATRARRATSGGRRGIDMATMFREFKLAVRTALKTPGYSAIAVLTLALAIGANTLLFSIASFLLIRPLPIKDAGRLGWVWQINGPSGVDRGPTSVADLLDLRARAKSFTILGGMEQNAGTLTGHGDAQHVTLARVTANFGDIWGLHAANGRLFLPGDDRLGHELSGVLAYHFWQKNFGADAGVVGKTFFLDGRPITIVGVMEPEIELGTLQNYDMWVPLPLDASLPRDQRTVRLTGHLAPGVTLQAADAEIHGLALQLAAAYPATNLNWDAHVVATRQALVGTNTFALLALLTVIVVFVLLIACANLANLVLARVVARRHDFAVRVALGASRLEVVRPLLLENLLLGLVGGLGGLAIAEAGLRMIHATVTDADPFLRQVVIDGYVLAFTVALAVLTPLVFSLWPAISAGRVASAETLRAARSSGGPRTRWQRNVLVGSQVALALSLLVVAGLVLQTIQKLHEIHIGLDINRILSFRVTLPPDQYRDASAWGQFARRAVQELGAVPGVEAAGVASGMPVFDPESVRSLTGTLHDGMKDTDRPWATCFEGSPDFFRAVGIGLLAGRTFDASDAASGQPVAVVSRMTAERYFDSVAGALGRTVSMHARGAADASVRVVGVVADTKNSEATKTSPQIWVPFDQQPLQSMTFVIRSESPGARALDVQAVMRRLNPAVAISEPVTMAKQVQDALASDSILTGLFAGFAMLALALAAAGLYGVISYSVGQRQREIGIRLALGAAPARIGRLVLTEGLKVTGCGIVVGLGLAALLAHGTASSLDLQGISPNDPKTFGAVIALLLVVAIVAIWGPARRAMRVDPVTTLRAD
jgi:putative ABC transport system permease protein